MNSLEQASALREIYEARRELVRLNEAEIEDLKFKLQKATEKRKELKAQLILAKANYEVASSKIVELLGDDDDEVNENERGSTFTKSSISEGCTKAKTGPRSATIGETTVKREESSEIVNLIDSDMEDTDGATSPHENEKRNGKRKVNNGISSEKRSRPSKVNHDVGTAPNSSLGATLSTEKETSEKENRISSSVAQDDVSHSAKKNVTIASNGKSEKTSTKNRPRAASSSGGKNRSEKTEVKKRTKSATFTRRIRHRERPSYVPPELWLKSSIGRTREELNSIDDIVQYMGSCQFSQSVVYSKFGAVYAIVLNDEWNELAIRRDQLQFWYVALGPGRKRDARLVGASQSTIPIFHAPKIQYSTKELFYVGHYKVMNIEDLNPPIVQNDTERDMRVTFAFDRFDDKLDSIIQNGSVHSHIVT